MDESLFKRLAEAHPSAAVSVSLFLIFHCDCVIFNKYYVNFRCLSAQYRMNQEIMEVCNHLVYRNRMSCATPETAQRRLSLPMLSSLPSPRSPPAGSFLPAVRSDWLFRAVLPESPVVFLNTDRIADSECPNGQETSTVNIRNSSEAKVVLTLLWAMRVAGCPVARSVGVITPFRAQVELLKKILDKEGRLIKWIESRRSCDKYYYCHLFCF